MLQHTETEIGKMFQDKKAAARKDITGVCWSASFKTKEVESLAPKIRRELWKEVTKKAGRRCEGNKI